MQTEIHQIYGQWNLCLLIFIQVMWDNVVLISRPGHSLGRSGCRTNGFTEQEIQNDGGSIRMFQQLKGSLPVRQSLLSWIPAIPTD